MNYTEGISHMLSLAEENGNFSPFAGIVIFYPGRGKKGDYRLTVQGGNAPTHAEIAKMLYDYILNNTFSYQQLKDLLSDIYTNGTNTTYSDPILKYLQHLIYWVTLQEEINFPRKLGNAGIKLPFCRYFEAIYSTQPLCTFTIATVLVRCNNHGKRRPDLFEISNAPDFYNY